LDRAENHVEQVENALFSFATCAEFVSCLWSWISREKRDKIEKEIKASICNEYAIHL